MERGAGGKQGSGELEGKGMQGQEVETRSNRSSATFMIGSRPNSLEIALREAFKSPNAESDLSVKFLSEIVMYGDDVVIEESNEHLEVHEDWPQP